MTGRGLEAERIPLPEFGLAEMERFSRDLRELGRDASCQQEVAQQLVRYLRRRLWDPDRDRSAICLARTFATTPGPILTLLASDGEQERWCTVEASRHREVPIRDGVLAGGTDVMGAMLEGLGIEAGVDPGSPEACGLFSAPCRVFHIPSLATHRRFQGQLARLSEHHLRSLLAFGGFLRDGHLFATVLFSSIPIPGDMARMFETLALSVKLALLPHTGVWSAADRGGPRTSTELEQRERLEVTEQLLGIHESIVTEQANGLVRLCETLKVRQLDLVRIRLELNRQLENARSSEQRYRALLDASPHAILVVDRDGTIQKSSAAAEASFGWARSRLADRELAEVLAEPLVWELRAILARGEGVLDAEAARGEAIRCDGTRFPCEIATGWVAPGDDESRRLVRFVLDRTEGAALEGQLAEAQKLESIGQLAAGVAHEINTPTQYVWDNIRFLDQSCADLQGLLTSCVALSTAQGEARDGLVDEIRGLVDDVDLEFLLEEMPRAILQSEEGIGRISKIVGAMKEFSHPGHESKVPNDLNRAIESTATVARNEWKYVAELELDLASDLPLVPCLPSELNQVILNLVVNAAHAIEEKNRDEPEAKGRIEIGTRLEGDEAVIWISDDGGGIPSEVAGKVFDPFFTTKEVGVGSGQGLAIAHSIVAVKHGGKIGFDSVEGEGTTFTIRLPLHESSREAS